MKVRSSKGFNSKEKYKKRFVLLSLDSFTWKRMIFVIEKGNGSWNPVKTDLHVVINGGSKEIKMPTIKKKKVGWPKVNENPKNMLVKYRFCLLLIFLYYYHYYWWKHMNFRNLELFLGRNDWNDLELVDDTMLIAKG